MSERQIYLNHEIPSSTEHDLCSVLLHRDSLSSTLSLVDVMPEELLASLSEDLPSSDNHACDSETSVETEVNDNREEQISALFTTLPKAEDLPESLSRLSSTDDSCGVLSMGEFMMSFSGNGMNNKSLQPDPGDEDSLTYESASPEVVSGKQSIDSMEIFSLEVKEATNLPEGLCCLRESADNHRVQFEPGTKGSCPDYFLQKASTKSKADLLAGAARAAEGQDQYLGLSDLAELVSRELPLMVFDRTLYLRNHTIWVPIDALQLACELSRRAEISKLFASLSSRNRQELYQRVLMIPCIQCNRKDLENDPALIPCKDGIFDTRTMRPRNISDRDYFFSCLQVSAFEIGNGSGTVFEEFVANLSAGDPAIRQRLLEIIGVILSGYLPKSFFVFIGPHDTGKSQVVNLLRRLINDDAVLSIPDPNTLSGEFGFSALPGKKLCYCPDAAEIRFSRKTVAAMKQLTGGDLLFLNRKHRDHATFVNESNFLLISNHPLHGSFDEAFKRRTVALPFQNSIPIHKQIQNLSEKLYVERGYIVHQAILALNALVDRDFVYTPVDSCDIFAEEPFGNADGHGLEAFIHSCCVFDDNAKETTASLYAAYVDFCQEHDCEPFSTSAVFSRCLRQCYPYLQEANTAQARGVKGIKLCTGIDSTESDFQ